MVRVIRACTALVVLAVACGHDHEGPRAQTPVGPDESASESAAPKTPQPTPEPAAEQGVKLQANPSPDSLAPDPPPFSTEIEVADYAALVGGKALTVDALHRLIRGNQFTFRALACDRAGELGDRALLPVLIDALSDESAHVGARHAAGSGKWTTRMRCHRALRSIANENFGYRWKDSRAEREQAIERWRRWYRTTAG